MPPQSQAVQVENLTKRYGPVVGAEDVSFSVEPGEVFGYLGPNGSGKTTTIRCIMGLLKPTSGRCSILGRTVRPGGATCHDRIGYLPGDVRFWTRLSAGRALEILSRLSGRPDCPQRRRRLADRLELDLSRRIDDLSKGNRQKVGVVGAFQNDPAVLILDEPTIGLDPLVRQTVLDLIRQAAGNGAAVLLSSHDLSEVSAVCRRAAILRAGRLVELASVSEIEQRGAKLLRVWFTSDARAHLAPIEKLTGVKILEHDAEMLSISYTGPVSDLLTCLSQLPVERIATRHAALEQAFMHYYGRQTEEPSR